MWGTEIFSYVPLFASELWKPDLPDIPYDINPYTSAEQSPNKDEQEQFPCHDKSDLCDCDCDLWASDNWPNLL